MTDHCFEMENPRLLNPLTLAFMGDVVYEQLVREYIIQQNGSLGAGKLHALSVEMVRASAQAAVYDAIEGELKDEERAILKRGRNSNSVCCPKNGSVADYRKATGVEALFGYLYFMKDVQRIQQLFSVAKTLKEKE